MSEPIIGARTCTGEFVVRRTAGRLRRDKRRRRAPSTGSRSRSSRASASATSAPTAPASRPRSRCSPASWCRPPGRSGSAASSRSGSGRELARRIGVVFGQRSQLWWDLPLRESFRLLAAIHRLAPTGLAAAPDELRRPARDGAVPRHPGAAAVARAADARRGHRGAAALPRAADARRADDRAGRAEQGAAAGLPDRANGSEPGTTLLLTTHDLRDIERLCDRVLVVDHGRLVFDGDAARPGHPGRRRAGARRRPRRARPAADRLPGTSLLTSRPTGCASTSRSTPRSTTAAAVLAAVSARVELRDLAIDEPDIEDVVRRLYAALTARQHRLRVPTGGGGATAWRATARRRPGC